MQSDLIVSDGHTSLTYRGLHRDATWAGYVAMGMMAGDRRRELDGDIPLTLLGAERDARLSHMPGEGQPPQNCPGLAGHITCASHPFS